MKMPLGPSDGDELFSFTEEAQAATTKKSKIIHRLISARVKAEWLTIRDLRSMATKSYIYRLLASLEKNGHVAHRYFYPTKGRRFKAWQATAQADVLVSPLSPLEEGLLPRPPPKREESRILEVVTRPIDKYVDTSRMYLDNARVSLELSRREAHLLRKRCNPPTRHDRADQYSLKTELFSITISKRNVAAFVLKDIEKWAKGVIDLCKSAGFSAEAAMSLMAEITTRLPDALVRVEMPVLLREIKEHRVKYDIKTRILDSKGRAVGHGIHSNINFSLNIDFESIGDLYRVDNFLSVLGSLQHSSVVAQEAIEQREKEKVEKQEKERNEAEEKLAKRLAEEDAKKKGDYYV